ncbi:MAG: hypothetical protein AAF488_00045 [Planctomycetota bacterium]
METPIKSKRRRWILGTLIIGASLVLVVFVSFFALLRPPISEENITVIAEELEALSRQRIDRSFTDATDAVLAVNKEARALQARFPKAVGTPLRDLLWDDAPGPEDATWVRLEVEAAPFLAALDHLPDNGRLPPLPDLTTIPAGLGNLSFVNQLCRALARSAEYRGDLSALVPLASRFAKLYLVRGTDTLTSHLHASILVQESLPILRGGIPHATEKDLRTALDTLRRASWETVDLERAIAASALRNLRLLQAAIEDPDTYVATTDMFPTAKWYVRSTTYLRYQTAHFARSIRRFSTPEAGAGWRDRADAHETTLLSISDNALSSWRDGLSTYYEFIVLGMLPGFYRTVSKVQTELVATRIAIAAELHRRDHARFPKCIDELDPWLDRTHAWLPNPDPLRIESGSNRCTIAIDAALDPIEFKIEEPE